MLQILERIHEFSDRLPFLNHIASTKDYDNTVFNILLNDKNMFRPLNKTLKLSAITLIIQKGYLSILQLLARKQKLPARIYYLIIHYGSLDLFKDMTIHSEIEYDCRDIFIHAARNQRWDFVKLLYKDVCEETLKQVIPYLVQYTQLDFLRKIYTKNMYHCMIDSTMKFGHLELLSEFHDHRNDCKTCKHKIFEVISQGHLHVLKWFVMNHGKDNLRKYIEHAAAHGHLEILEFLHSCDQNQITQVALDYAVGEGHVMVAQWILRETNLKISNKAAILAACQGHLDMIKWICGALSKDILYQMLYMAQFYQHYLVNDFLTKVISYCNNSSNICDIKISHKKRGCVSSFTEKNRKKPKVI